MKLAKISEFRDKDQLDICDPCQEVFDQCIATKPLVETVFVLTHKCSYVLFSFVDTVFHHGIVKNWDKSFLDTFGTFNFLVHHIQNVIVCPMLG